MSFRVTGGHNARRGTSDIGYQAGAGASGETVMRKTT